MTSSIACQARLGTTSAPGAIAIVQLTGSIDSVLAELTGRPSTPLLRPTLSGFGRIDEGIVVRWSEQFATLMPHGGPRVVQRIVAALSDLGVEVGADQPASAIFPEAGSAIEAVCLEAVTQLHGTLGLTLLLDQPRRWAGPTELDPEDTARSARLSRMFDPPLVVVVGPPNVGKSSLSNRLLGRQVSVAADLQGTTRDYVAARANLNGLVVRWADTPGLRTTSDRVESDAQSRAREIHDQADLLLAMTDHIEPWPDLGRAPDLRIANKSDLGRRTDADLCICAHSGSGIPELVHLLRQQLLPDADLSHPGPWVFDERLAVVSDQMPIEEYPQST